MHYVLDEQQCKNVEVSSRREWLLPNGIGGYAMGTACGINTRRYHALLIAATTPPTGRMALLAGLEAFIQPPGGNSIGLSANQYAGAIYPEGYGYLRSFSVGETAIWNFRASGLDIEKEVAIHPGLNAVSIFF